MAKKKQDLSPEERLAAAFVPEEEWPYTLPDGWNWVRIGALNDYKSSSITPSTNPDDTFELYSVPSIVNDYPEITKGMDIGSTKQLVEKDDVLLCKINPRINRVWKVSAHTTHKCLASSEWIVVRARSFFASDYLMWFFRCPYFRERMLSNVSGVGGSLMRAKPRYVQTYPVALPPLSEQHRLVARIESLFAKLDAAKEKVQSVLDSQENRKAALLHDAFVGKLTAKWRDGQSTMISSWKPISFEDCIEKMQNGLSKRKGDAGEYVNVLRLTNIAPEGLSFQDMRKILLTSDEKEKYKLAPEDVLMVRVNGSKDNVGKQLYIDKKDADNQLTFCDHLIRIHYNEQLVAPQFMVYFSHTMQYKSYVEKNMVSSAGQNTISRKGMKNLSLMLPSLPEQQAIVRILDRLLAREQRARQTAEETLTAIERMKQAILARAFRGEL